MEQPGSLASQSADMPLDRCLRRRGTAAVMQGWRLHRQLYGKLCSRAHSHACCILLLFFKPSPKDMFLLILEREKGGWGEREGEGEKERDIDVRGKHQLVSSCMCPDQGSNLQPFGAGDATPTN